MARRPNGVARSERAEIPNLILELDLEKNAEDLLPLSAVPNCPGCPKPGASAYTVTQWVNHGVKSVHGEIVHLEVIQGTESRMTTQSAIYRFVRRINGQTIEPKAAQPRARSTPQTLKGYGFKLPQKGTHVEEVA